MKNRSVRALCNGMHALQVCDYDIYRSDQTGLWAVPGPVSGPVNARVLVHLPLKEETPRFRVDEFDVTETGLHVNAFIETTRWWGV